VAIITRAIKEPRPSVAAAKTAAAKSLHRAAHDPAAENLLRNNSTIAIFPVALPS
jgi:hypothetical protein